MRTNIVLTNNAIRKQFFILTFHVVFSEMLWNKWACKGISQQRLGFSKCLRFAIYCKL